MAASFDFFRWRFHFRAVSGLRFPAGKAANCIRGGLGLALRECAHARASTELFRPEGSAGRTPSGLADPPRPFLIRAAHLDGLEFAAGSAFFWDIHAFELERPQLDTLREAFGRLAQAGIGPGRGSAVLERVQALDLLDRAAEGHAPLSIDLGATERATGVRLGFLTPTELKGAGGLVERPGFGILFGRLRDRIGALSALYGRGPLAVDYRGLGERAAAVRLLRCQLEWRQPERRSTRTSQVHAIGGLTGEAEYAGELGEFLPWLAAARWAGVGRHTVWGNGDVRILEVRGRNPA